VGALGLALAIPFKLIVRDRPRVAPCPSAPEMRLSEIARMLAAKRSFWLLAFGAASSSMLGYGLAFWLPSLLQRSFGLDLVETSWFIGAVLILGGVTGMLAGGGLSDRLGKASKAWYAWLPAIAFVIAVPLFAGGIWVASVALAFALFLIPQALAYVWLGPVLSAVQHLVPAPARSTASAMFLLINNLFGLGGGIYALGALSTALMPTYGSEALRMSMLFSLGLYMIAAVLMGLAGRYLPGDWVDEAG